MNEIKDNDMKTIACAAINLSVIALLTDNLEQLSMNTRIEVAKFEPKPTFKKTINDIKSNQLKIITSVDMNVSFIILNKPYFSSEHLETYLISYIPLQSSGK